MATAVPAWATEFADLSDAVELAAECTAFLQERLDRMGIDPSGLYNFYAQRLASGAMFSQYELQLARYCAQSLRAFDSFIEVGCGVGQLPLLMAMQGLNVIGIENDWKRAACAGDLKFAMAGRYPLIAANARIMYGTFPAALPPEVDKRRAVLLCNCLVFTHTPEQALAFVREMHTYPLSIIDMTRFMKIRRDDASKQELYELLEQEGFERPAPLGPASQWDGEFVALLPRR